MRTKGSAAQRIANMGLLFALAAAVSALEGMLPPIVPVPGVKPGFSNIVTMYCLFAFGGRDAFTIAALKSMFALLTRGATAASLSFCGGILSVAAMLLIARVKDNRTDVGIISVAGAIVHNIGQLGLACMMLNIWQVFWYYIPILIASGVITGLLTSALFRALKPYFRL